MEDTKMIMLEKEECLRLRPLWEEVFYEDSVQFTEYYFGEKAMRNVGFALCGEEGIRAMLYLTPYSLMMRAGNDWDCRELNYIIGVATKQEYRHRGYMNRLLRAALEQMHKEKKPFTFLMPANPAIYEPYQFTYVYNRPRYRLDKRYNHNLEFAGEEDCSRLAAFASEWFAQYYDVFMRRDEEYFRLLIKELKAQNGGIVAEYSKDKEEKVCGYFLYAKEEEQEEIQEAVYMPDNKQSKKGIIEGLIQEEAEKKPIIMARIVDVGEMLGLLRTTGKEVCVQLKIEDSILESNMGIWMCRWSENQSRIQKTEDRREEKKCENGMRGKNSAILQISIEKLTAWVFGYQTAEECFKLVEDCKDEERRQLFDELAQIKVLRRVCINEIV